MARERRLAAVHAAPVWMDAARSVEKACDFIRQAGDDDVDLLVFPEVFVPGFPHWINCYAPITFAPIQQQYAAQSLDVGGEELVLVRQACESAGVDVVLGFTERSGGTLYNAQAFISRTGELCGVHRKLMPTHAERTVWGQGDGSGLRTWSMPSGITGGLVCWEHTMNLARQALIVQGEEIHAASWPALDSLAGWEGLFSQQVEVMCRNHAISGQCFVVVAMSPVDQQSIDTMEALMGPQQYLTAGGAWSAIIDPMTVMVGGPHTGMDETIVTADIDLDGIGALKVFADATGHYGRSDILRLYHDRSVHQPGFDAGGEP